MSDIIFLTIVYIVLGAFLAVWWADNCPEKFSDYTLIRILTGIPLAPVLLIIILVGKTVPFFTSKPFKKSRFSVGEEVMFDGKLARIIKNEKQCEGANVLIKMNGDYFERLVDAKSVKKLTKLEQALK